MKKPNKGRQPASLLKVRAKNLRNALSELFELELGHSNCLELVAREEGFRNWNTASATAPAHLLTASDMLSSEPWQITIDASTTGKSAEQLVEDLQYVVKHVLNPDHPASFIVFSAPDEETYSRVIKLTAELIHEQTPGNFSLVRPPRDPHRLFIEANFPDCPDDIDERQHPSVVKEMTPDLLFYPLRFLARHPNVESSKRLVMMGSSRSDATYSLERIFCQAMKDKFGGLKNVLRHMALNDAFLLVDLSVDGNVAKQMSTPESLKTCIGEFFNSNEQVRGIADGSMLKERANILRAIIADSSQALDRPVPKWKNINTQTFEDLLTHPLLPAYERSKLLGFIEAEVVLRQSINQPQESVSAKLQRIQADQHVSYLTMELAKMRDKAS